MSVVFHGAKDKADTELSIICDVLYSHSHLIFTEPYEVVYCWPQSTNEETLNLDKLH